MNIKDIQTQYKKAGKNREAGFIEKFYIEKKGTPQIIDELYLNSKRTFYKLKSKVRNKIKESYLGK